MTTATMSPAETRALVLEAPETVHVQTVPLPPPGADEVVLQTLACGVCGSDLRYFVGDNPWAQHTLGHQAPIDWNRTILGHEACARIVQVGADVSPSRIGEVVVVQAMHPCGVCAECQAGNRNLCKMCHHLGHGGGWPEGYDRPFFPGAMADSFLYFADECLPIPQSDALPEEFALADMVGVAVHAFGRAKQVRARGLPSGAKGLVIGCGQVGLSIAQVAKAQGVHAVGVDTGAVPRRIAGEVGISCAASLDDGIASGPFDAIWDTVCTPETLATGLSRLAPGGVAVLLAPHEMNWGIAPLSVGGERTVTTSCNFDPPADLGEAIRLIGSRAVDMRPYITRRVALSDAPQAFADLHTHRDRDFKVVISP